MDLRHRCNIANAIRQKLAADPSYKSKHADNLAVARIKRWEKDNGKHSAKMKDIMRDPVRIEHQRERMENMWNCDTFVRKMICNRHSNESYFKHKMSKAFGSIIENEKFTLRDTTYSFYSVPLYKKAIVATDDEDTINKIERWCKLHEYTLIVVNINSVFDDETYRKITSNMCDCRPLIKIGNDFGMPMIGVI